MSRIEVKPASLSMVQQTVEGDKVKIDDDVLGVARALRDIDEGLRLEFDTDQGYYVVLWHHLDRESGDMKDKLVLTAMELDARIVTRVRQISLPDYDFVGELERREAEAERDEDRRRLNETTGPAAEKLRHALRKDLGFEDRIFVPGGRGS